MPTQQVHHESRNQGSRQQIRSQHRKDDCFRHWNEQIPRDPREEEHRHENDADGQGRHKCWHRDLLRAVEDGLFQFFLHSQVALNVLDFYGRVVHQNADRQRQSAQRHDVERFPHRAEQNDRGENRERDGDGDNQRRAPVPEEEQDHGRGEASCG